MSTEESIPAQSSSFPAPEAPAEASLELCIHLTWCQQQQCCTGGVAGSQRGLVTSCHFPIAAGRAQVGTCATRSLLGEGGTALGPCDSWLGQDSAPSPSQQGCYKLCACPACLGWASPVLTPPGGAEVGHPQSQAKASRTSFVLWSKSLFSSQTRGVVILISTAIFTWWLIFSWLFCVRVCMREREWLLAAVASAVTELWLCERTFPSCSWPGPAQSSWAVSPKPPLLVPAAAWALGCFPVPAVGPWGCSTGHLNCTHSMDCAFLITIKIPQNCPIWLGKCNKTKRWQIKSNVNKCKLSGIIWWWAHTLKYVPSLGIGLTSLYIVPCD